jgi:hypothetical protein
MKEGPLGCCCIMAVGCSTGMGQPWDCCGCGALEPEPWVGSPELWLGTSTMGGAVCCKGVWAWSCPAELALCCAGAGVLTG